jgi:hypothetical protein
VQEICFAMWTSDLFMKRVQKIVIDLDVSNELDCMMCMVRN